MAAGPIANFVLAIVIGYYVIGHVHHALHTPLMSVTNAISSVIVVGAMLATGLATVACGGGTPPPAAGGPPGGMAMPVELQAATPNRLLWYMTSPPDLVKVIKKIFR